MTTRFFFVLSIIFAVALAQVQPGFQDVRNIDTFDAVTPTILIVVPNNPSFPMASEQTTIVGSSDGVIGNERNLLLTVLSGESNDVLSTGVSNSDFSCTTPQDATGVTLLQYDGSDSSSALNPNGLRQVSGLSTNLRDGDAFAFHARMESDHPTNVIFRVYSGSSTNYCEAIQPLPGDDVVHDYFVNYNEFNDIGSGCDFSNVGAIEVVVEMFENVDVIIEIIATYGPIPNTVTPTRTKSPSPTPRPPSGTPTPSPPPTATCNCFCPVFVCHVLRIDDGNYYFYNFEYDFFFFNAFFGYFDDFYQVFFTQFFYYFDFFYVPFFFDFYYFDDFFGGFFLPFFYGLFA